MIGLSIKQTFQVRIGRNGSIAELIMRIRIRAHIRTTNAKMTHSQSTCANQVVRRIHGRVTGISLRKSNHAIYVILNILDKSFDDI